MSLPNPKQYVTEERLNEYHNIILPFLGGMPDILANKFARGDMYSTDEKMIGQWIDGKPLYQKTIIDTTAKTGSFDIDISSLNAEYVNIIEILLMADDGNGGIVYTPNPIVFSNSDYWFVNLLWRNKIQIEGTNARITSRADKGYILTLQYTKTTDSPVEIGLDTDYSTEEKIVGTWIDGKPLYQKTFVDKCPNSAGVKNYAHNISNVEMIKITESFMKWSGSFDYSPIPAFSGSTSVPISTALITIIGVDQNNIRIRADENRSAHDLYITLQYTKTTD